MDEQCEQIQEVGIKFWRDHYDELANHDSHTLFSSESRDYLARLREACPVTGGEYALDFGSGFGFISSMLAGTVHKLEFWDSSPNMLARTVEAVSDFANASPIDLEHPGDDPRQRYDLIVVNSVIQYMSVAEFLAWLNRWRNMLKDDGKVLVSDIVLPKSAFLREVWDSLHFAAREGFLFTTLWHDCGQFAKYLITRNRAPMTRYTEREFAAIAGRAGLDTQVLPINLTYRASRFSVLLKKSPRR